MVQWLRLHTPIAGGLGLITQELHLLQQLRVLMIQIKTPHASSKTQHSQKNKLIKNLKKLKSIWESFVSPIIYLLQEYNLNIFRYKSEYYILL